MKPKRKPYAHKEITACEELVHRLGTGRISKAAINDPRYKTLWENTVATCGNDMRVRAIVSTLRRKKGKLLFKRSHSNGVKTSLMWKFCPGCAKEIASTRWAFCPTCGMKFARVKV